MLYHIQRNTVPSIHTFYRRGLCLLLSAFILILLTSPISAYAVNNDDWKTVRVSTGINKALYLNADGEPEGYCSEYLSLLAKINHWNLEYVEASWTDSMQNLYDGKIDLLFPTQLTDERARTMSFSTSIGGYQPIGLFANKDSDYCFDDYERFDGSKVALTRGTSNESAMNDYAKEHGFSYIPVYINSTQDKLKALEDGSVDLIVFSTLNDVTEGKVVAMLDYLPFYYCTNIENTDLLKELNYGMNQMLIRHPVQVQDVFYNFMNRNITFAYTVAEKEAIEAKGSVVVGIYKDAPPLFTVNADGSYKGIYVDIIHRIEALSGLDITIQALDPREDAYDYLDTGRLDFVLNSRDQALKYLKRGDYVESDGIMDYYTVSISRPDFIPSNDLPMKFALTGGRRYWVNQISAACPAASFTFYDTSKECLDAVLSGKCDITLLNTWEYNYQSKNSRFQNLIEWETSRTLTETVFVSLENEDALIRSVMDKSIEQIANSEKEAMITANLNGAYQNYNLADRLYSLKEGIVISFFIFAILIAAFLVYIFMRKKNIQELKEKNIMLENANTSKNRFLSRMSHELRTPLNAINGYTTIIEQNLDAKELDTKTFRSNLESIHRAVKYQLAIISDLLDIQKIESGNLELHKIEVDTNDYIQQIISMIQPEAEAKKIHFTYEAPSCINDTYLMDGVRFQQVLLNILHNAIKFTPENGHVTLTTQVIDHGSKKDTLKYVISDDGIGMSEDFQQNYLFKRFAQEYNDTTSPYEGCGTGLAISREIMHLMGGDISCESTQGVGSSFTIIFVAEHVSKKQKVHVKPDYSQYDLSGVHVLLCEDNPMNQDMERRMLEKMNCIVDIANDGVIGLSKFAASENGFYDVVLMDIRMPNMDGWACTRQIRALNRADAKSVAILAVSANAFEEDVRQSLDCGMNEHLSKPIDFRIMYKKIKQYCKQIPQYQ